MCTVLVMRFRDFGFYISEPANLHAVKSRAIAARISPFILLSNAHFQTYSRYDKVAKSSPRNLSPNCFGISSDVFVVKPTVQKSGMFD